MKVQRTQKRNRKSLAATAVLATVALAYVFFVFLPKQEEIAEMRRELDRQQEFLLRVDRLRYSIKTADEELTLATNYSQQWQSRSPSKTDFNEKLARAADESGVTITKFEPQPVEKMAHICQLPINLSSEGTFVEMLQFLSEIESFETTIWLESLAIERLAVRPSSSDRRNAEEASERQNGETYVRCQMTMKVFADKSKFSD